MQENLVEILHVPGELNHSDALTKILSKRKMEELIYAPLRTGRWNLDPPSIGMENENCFWSSFFGA